MTELAALANPTLVPQTVAAAFVLPKQSNYRIKGVGTPASVISRLRVRRTLCRIRIT